MNHVALSALLVTIHHDAFGGLFFYRMIRSPKASYGESQVASTPIYTNGNFTFASPQALTHLPILPLSVPFTSPTKCPSIKDQGIRTRIKVISPGTFMSPRSMGIRAESILEVT